MLRAGVAGEVSNICLCFLPDGGTVSDIVLFPRKKFVNTGIKIFRKWYNSFQEAARPGLIKSAGFVPCIKYDSEDGGKSG